MNREKEKYNNKKARYLARLVLQNRYNKNRGVTYEKAVAENMQLKTAIDHWISVETGTARPLHCGRGGGVPPRLNEVSGEVLATR